MWWCLYELTRLRIFIWSINILCTQLLHRYPHPQRSFSFKKNSIKWWKEAYLYIKASLQVGIENEILSFPSSSELWAHQEIWGQRVITCTSFLTRSCNLCLSGQHPYCNNGEQNPTVVVWSKHNWSLEGVAPRNVRDAWEGHSLHASRLVTGTRLLISVLSFEACC